MRTFFLKNLLLIFTLLCTLKSPAQTAQVKESALIGCWSDSYEENASAALHTYRPCTYKTFPASRFRFQMELNRKGKCRYLHLASNDAHHMAEGTWTFDAKSGLVEILDAQGNPVMKFKVISLNKDLMEIEKA